MTHQIRTVKPEIRILGIDACRDGAIVGAIVRGGLYLDGILNFQGTITGKVSEQIQQSRYYLELRVIMLHDPKGRLNIGQLWKTTGLPVIAITKTRLRLRNNHTLDRKSVV